MLPVVVAVQGPHRFGVGLQADDRVDARLQVVEVQQPSGQFVEQRLVLGLVARLDAGVRNFNEPKAIPLRSPEHGGSIACATYSCFPCDAAQDSQ